MPKDKSPSLSRSGSRLENTVMLASEMTESFSVSVNIGSRDSLPLRKKRQHEHPADLSGQAKTQDTDD